MACSIPFGAAGNDAPGFLKRRKPCRSLRMIVPVPWVVITIRGMIVIST